MLMRYARLLLVPAVAVLGVSLGALGGAVAFDHFAAQYLWPEPEDVVIRPYVPRYIEAVPQTAVVTTEAS